MPTPRAPEAIRRRLLQVLASVQRGPFVWYANAKERAEREQWAKTWVLPELRAVLQYLEGRATVREIEERVR